MADSIRLLLPAAASQPSTRIEVCRESTWTPVSSETTGWPDLNLRPAAVAMLKQAGITHILTPVAHEGIGVLGERLVNAADDWGLEILDNLHAIYLLKLR